MQAAASSDRPSVAAIGNAVLLVVALLALSTAAGAQTPAAACRASFAGRAVSVHVQVDDLFPSELLRLVGLGLTGRLQVEIDLVRRRPLWFSRRVARHSFDVAVARGPAGEGLLLDGEPIADPSRLRLPRIQLPVEGEPDQLEAQVRVQLRVITPGSLGKMAAWVAGGESKQEERSALSAGLLSIIADELARSVETSCPVARRSK
jgi:hypothetical protein